MLIVNYMESLDKEDIKDSVPKSIKYIIYILLLGLLGVVLGIGFQLLSENTKENISPLEISTPDPQQETGDGIGIKFDDEIKDWNLKAAPYLSPLLSQLARTPRTTLGSHKALCKDQRNALDPVLLLELPKNKVVASSFNKWRQSVKLSLDNCLSYEPTGNDIRDIKNIYKKVEDTQKLFDKFLKSQIEDVDVQFQLNPGMFEK
jgi:hypothetical protein